MGAKKKTVNKRVMEKAERHARAYDMGEKKLEEMFGGNRGGGKTMAMDNECAGNPSIVMLPPIAQKLTNQRLAEQLYAELPIHTSAEDFEKFIGKIKVNARLRLHLVRMKQQLEYMNECSKEQNRQIALERQRREVLEKEYSSFRDSSRQSAAVEFVKAIGQFLNSAQFMLHNLDVNSRGRSEEATEPATREYPAARQAWDRVNYNKCVDEKAEDARIRR